MAKKHYPVIRKFSVANTTGVPQLHGVVDTMKNLSQINHRLYRQSRIPEVSVTIDANVANGSTINVYALADSWWTMKALQMAKSAWDKANESELAMLDGKKARWNDFRVDDGVGGADILTAVQFDTSLAPVNFTAGEFVASTCVDAAGASRGFTWGTPAASQFGIYDEYDKSGNTNVDPTTPATGPYSGLLPNLEAGAAAALQDQGNNPPYNATGYGSGIWVKVGTLHLESGRQRLSTGFFKAPCGFVVLENFGTVASAADVQIEIKKGDYKGVHAPSMLE